MCRNLNHGGRRCPSYTDPVLIANRNARRRALYAARKQGVQVSESPSNTGVSSSSLSGLNEAQSAYFAETKVRDEDGNPLKVYHGSAYEFTEFDPSRLGQGNDAWGNGFYFSHSESVSRGYANDSGSEEANVKEFYLDIKNPIYMDGVENMSMNEYMFTARQAEEIILSNPSIYSQPGDEDNPNPMEDYSPEFWDKEEWSEDELRSMARKVAREYFSDSDWVTLESFYGRENGSAYLHAVKKATGHDGVIVDFGDDGKHYVAWFPEQMKLTSNENPQINSKF